jgi:hypothetical protein
MADIGIMVYGFSEVEARSVNKALEEILGEEVILISGCGRENDVVAKVLEDGSYSVFEAKEDPRIVMFLGFDGPRIHTSLAKFPNTGGRRPIFCTPTEKNITWTMSALIKDLMEEREYFNKQEQERKQQKEKRTS